MAHVEHINEFLQAADQLVRIATKDELAEALRLVSMNLAHYQSKYGDLPLDETLVIAYTDEPNAAQLQLTVDGMEVMIGILGSVVQGFEPQSSH
jgi:hypothetical protein